MEHCFASWLRSVAFAITVIQAYCGFDGTLDALAVRGVVAKEFDFLEIS